MRGVHVADQPSPEARVSAVGGADLGAVRGAAPGSPGAAAEVRRGDEEEHAAIDPASVGTGTARNAEPGSPVLADPADERAAVERDPAAARGESVGSGATRQGIGDVPVRAPQRAVDHRDVVAVRELRPLAVPHVRSTELAGLHPQGSDVRHAEETGALGRGQRNDAESGEHRLVSRGEVQDLHGARHVHRGIRVGHDGDGLPVDGEARVGARFDEDHVPVGSRRDGALDVLERSAGAHREDVAGEGRGRRSREKQGNESEEHDGGPPFRGRGAPIVRGRTEVTRRATAHAGPRPRSPRPAR